MAILNQEEVSTLIRALIESGLDTIASRGALFQFINPQFKAALQTGLPAPAQLLTDIGRMSKIERLANGDVPLEIYLRNADLLLADAEEQQKIVRAMLSRVVQRSSGAGRIDPAGVPETKERIVHTDDTVTFAFMEAGVKAGASVMKLRVPRYDNGQPRWSNGNAVQYVGTGWLLSERLVMTNHHVINARNDDEANALEADLRLQAKGTRAVFDFDGEGLPGLEVAVEVLEAWEAKLDYAVLRVAPTKRIPLRRAITAVDKQLGSIPVNIIQHPGGRSKRYGIRNNLVTASTETELRYFTDTEAGSSGSPVFNDLWHVVALHRASAYVENVQFQGKSTAYVNVGTHLTSILKDLQDRYPAVAAEIAQ